MNLSTAINALYSLNVGVVGTGNQRHERPHKPVLLLAALDAVAKGRTPPQRIEWSQWLRSRFRAYFEVVRSSNDDIAPELPFFHLRKEGFWEPVRLSEDGPTPLSAPPSAADAEAGNVCALITGGWDHLFAVPADRAALREAIIARYFPKAREILPKPHSPERQVTEDEMQDEAVVARSAAFRRQVVEAYDYQCTACGLRIRMPDREITFVDAAHLLPFSISRNDHPSNGLALCKNHHWALDQYLIAPNPEGIWQVSRLLDSRRSPGERELAELRDKPLLTPTDSAYAPLPEGLRWRYAHLLA
ncbi:MAG: HNH endonuclease [Opitutaceae bacterium]|jgi:putative restriction endonuclease